MTIFISTLKDSIFHKSLGLSNLTDMRLRRLKEVTHINNHNHNHIGGRHIFIDLGANDGSSLRFFMNLNQDGNNIPTQGGPASSILKGHGQDGTWEVVLFEPNPRFSNELKNLTNRLLKEQRVKKVHLFTSTVIYNQNLQSVPFFFDTFEGDAGATLVKDTMNGRRVGLPIINVTAVDIVTLFREILQVKVSDTVIVKVDIEGYEFEMLRRVATRGLLPYIDVLATEWHDENNAVLGDVPVYKTYHQCLNWLFEENSKLITVPWGR